MTPRDQEALAIYQENRSAPREQVEALLDQFFRFASAADYEEQLKAVASEMELAS